jgi:hypothetical protein
VGRINYPSPFFDLSSTYLPNNIKDLFLWCEYYFLTNPLVNTVVSKLAEYPITDIIVEHKTRKVREKWEKYINDVLFLRGFCIETGLDYYTFGSAYVSVLFPFVKQVRCKSCGDWFVADAIKKSWKFNNFRFALRCPSCHSRTTADVRDVYYKNLRKVRVVRWNPKQITVAYNEVTGKAVYYYAPPKQLINDVNIGIKDTIINTPQMIIEAIRRPENRLKLNEDNFYHIKRPSLSSRDTGYGVPILLPVLKDLFYLQVLKRAQEAVAASHIVPLRAIYPQAPTASGDPLTTLNLQQWRREVKSEINNWRRDPNYIPVLGFPLGHEQLGGDARALLLASEIQVWSDMIVAGMGIPRELIFGGVSWSGTNVSLRILENKFLNYITQLEHMIRFVMNKLAAYTGWPEASARFRPFKMADDLQRKMLLLQMAQAGKVSDQTLMEECDLDSETEDKMMQEEAKRRTSVLKEQQKATAEMQGEAMVVQAKYQQQVAEMNMEFQQEQMQQQGQPQLEDGTSPLQMDQMNQQQSGQMQIQQAAGSILKQINGMEPMAATKYMAALKARLPDLASVVTGLAEQQATASQQQLQGAAKPNPEQKPPRRENPSI